MPKKRKIDGQAALRTVAEGNGGTLNIPEDTVSEEQLFLPDLEGVSDPNDIKARDKRIQDKAPSITAWVPMILRKMEELETLTPDQKALFSAEEKQRVQEAGEEVQRFIHKEKKTPWRRAAQLAYVLYFLSKAFQNINDVISALMKLAQEGILAGGKDGTGPIRLGTRNMHWTTPDGSPLDNDAVATIQMAVENALSNVTKRQLQKQQEEAQQLRTMGNLTAREFMAGQLGRLVLAVPDYTDDDSKVFHGGVVVLDLMEEKNGAVATKVIRPVVMTESASPSIALAGKFARVAATGELKTTYAETVALGAFLKYDSLGWKEAPFLAIPEDISWLPYSQATGEPKSGETYKLLLKLLLTEATITFLEFLEGKDGILCLFVPTVEDSSKKKHMGGAMLVKKKGNEVSILKAIGAIEADCAAVTKAGTFLKYHSLAQKKVPYSEPKGRMQTQVNLMWTLVQSSLFHARRKKIKMLWHTVGRGLKKAVEQEKAAEEEQTGGSTKEPVVTAGAEETQ